MIAFIKGLFQKIVNWLIDRCVYRKITRQFLSEGLTDEEINIIKNAAKQLA